MKKMDKKNLQKIAIVATILLLIGVVWVAKNRETVFEQGGAAEEYRFLMPGRKMDQNRMVGQQMMKMWRDIFRSM